MLIDYFNNFGVISLHLVKIWKFQIVCSSYIYKCWSENKKYIKVLCYFVPGAIEMWNLTVEKCGHLWHISSFCSVMSYNSCICLWSWTIFLYFVLGFVVKVCTKIIVKILDSNMYISYIASYYYIIIVVYSTPPPLQFLLKWNTSFYYFKIKLNSNISLWSFIPDFISTIKKE